MWTMKSPVYAVYCYWTMIFLYLRDLNPIQWKSKKVTLQICPIDIVYQRCAMCIHAIFAKRANAAEQISLNNLYFICHGVFSGLIASGLRTIKKKFKSKSVLTCFQNIHKWIVHLLQLKFFVTFQKNCGGFIEQYP